MRKFAMTLFAGLLTLPLQPVLPMSVNVAQAQDINDNLLRQLGSGLGLLKPREQQSTPVLRPENKIPQRTPDRQIPPGGNPAPSGDNFDFYVLSLSWSPSYCAENGNRPNSRQQCGGSRSFGFVAHGLWPQYERGYPESCNHAQANQQVPRDLVSALSQIMPSAGLMRHEWRKHGTCSGLDQRGYFNILRDAYQAVSIPPSLRTVASPRRADPQLIEKAFIAANPGLPADAIAVTCNRQSLDEVRICLTKNLKFRSCKQVNNNACRSRSVNILPNR